MSRTGNLKGIVALAAAGAGVMLAAGTVVYNYSINRSRKYLFGPYKKTKLAVGAGEFMRADLSEETVSWAEQTAISQRKTTAFDGIALNAYAFEQKKESHRWLIAVHGYGQAPAAMFNVAKPFYEAGFNVLIPECRGTGHSGGDFYGLGWVDRLDVIRWCYSIIAEDPSAEFVLYGVSTGADAVLMASGEESLPANVRCVIADSAYSKLTELSNHLMKRQNLPAGPLTFSTSIISTFMAGYSFADASAVNQVAKSKTPTLFIHGGVDEYCPVEMAYELYEAASCPKDLLIVSDADHGYAMFADYNGYWSRVWQFIDRYAPSKKEEKSYFERLRGQIFRKQ